MKTVDKIFWYICVL